MKIILAINYVDYSDPLKKKLQEDSIKTMTEKDNVQYISLNFKNDIVNLPIYFGIYKTLTRDSSETIQNTRRLPYIKEILDKTSKIDCDIFGYVNSDILLKNDFFDIFKDEYDVYMFSRFDVVDSKDFKIISDKHPGYDGIFFKREWWLNYRNIFNDNLILGEPAWDDYYYRKINKHERKFFVQRRLYHVYHATTWNLNSNGAKNNINIMYGGK